ncbi:MAG: hypothetical protein IJ439_03570 [Tyzzerella sp.]|nr:hypothetical protein [Tyzzerella sp.]
MSGTNLAKAYVQIVPSAEGIKGSISNVLNNEAGTAGDAAGKTVGNSLASKIKTVIAAAGIGTALKSALTEGADLQQSLGGIETLFKDSANVVIENAKNAYKTAGLSANEYMESVTSFSASLLQGLSGDTNKAAEVADIALTDMSDNANKMGTSMELIQNAYQGFAKQNYTMLDNLKLGYGGTKTEMERLLADAQKLTGVKYDINNLSDVYSAIHAIQENMGITGTTAKEASETFSGSLASMKAAASNVLGNLTLGKDIVPSLAALGDTVHTFIANNLIPMLGNIVKAIPQALVQVRNMMINELNLVGNNSNEIMQSGVEFVKELATAVVSSIPYLGEAAFNLISAFGKTIVETDWLAVATDIINELKDCLDVEAGEIFGSDENFLDALIESIGTQLPILLEQGVEVVTNFINGILSNIPMLIETARGIVDKVYTCIMENAPKIWESGVDLLLNIVNGITENLPAIADSAIGVVDKLLNTIFENAPQMLDSGIILLEELINGIIDSLPKLLSAAAQLVADLLQTVLQYAPKLIEGGLTLLGKLAAGLIRAIPDLLAKIPGIISDIKEKFTSIDWGEIGKNIIKGIANGISNFASSVVDAAREVGAAALDALEGFFDIHSPSKKTEQRVGKNIDLGVAKGVENNVSSVIDSMKELSRATLGTIDTDFLSLGVGMNSAKSNWQITNSAAELEALGRFIVNAISEQGDIQAQAVKEGISNIKMVPNEREFVRFVDNLGFTRG